MPLTFCNFGRGPGGSVAARRKAGVDSVSPKAWGPRTNPEGGGTGVDCCGAKGKSSCRGESCLSLFFFFGGGGGGSLGVGFFAGSRLSRFGG